MNVDVPPLTVIQARSPQTPIVQFETQGFDQMQIGSSVSAEADYIARIRGDFGLVKQYVKHDIGCNWSRS